MLPGHRRRRGRCPRPRPAGTPRRGPRPPVPSRKSSRSWCWPNLARLPGDHEVKAPLGPALLVEPAYLAAQCLRRSRVRGLPDAVGRLGIAEQQRLGRHHEVLGRGVGHAVHGEIDRPPLAQAALPDPARRRRPVPPERQEIGLPAVQDEGEQLIDGAGIRRGDGHGAVRIRTAGGRASLFAVPHHEDVNRVLALDDKAVALVERPRPASLQDVQPERALTPVIREQLPKHLLSRLPFPADRRRRRSARSTASRRQDAPRCSRPPGRRPARPSSRRARRPTGTAAGRGPDRTAPDVPGRRGARPPSTPQSSARRVLPPGEAPSLGSCNYPLRLSAAFRRNPGRRRRARRATRPRRRGGG